MVRRTWYLARNAGRTEIWPPADRRRQRGNSLAEAAAVHFVARRSRPWEPRSPKHRRAVHKRGPMILTAAPLRLGMLVSNAVSNGDELWQQRATFRDRRGHADSSSGQQKRRCYRKNGARRPLTFNQWVVGSSPTRVTTDKRATDQEKRRRYPPTPFVLCAVNMAISAV